jgi:hypothetical protein
MPLPKWVVDNESSIREEAAPYVGLTPEERANLLGAACRAGAKLLRARPDAARVLEHVDPLPESSEKALTRLRAQKRGAGAGTE